MTRITVITNQKGGVGKTTTSHALICALRKLSFRTLAIDTDPQSNLTITMNADETIPGVYEMLKGEISPQDAIQKTNQGDIISASLMLSGADLEFTTVGREYLLADCLEQLKDQYDHIIIDSPPTLGILTINALTASNDVIIPLGADTYSLQELAQLNTTISVIKKRCNPNLSIAGLLLTRYNGRTILSKELREIIEEKAQQIGTKAFNTVIREGIAIKEAQAQRGDLFELCPKSNPAMDYLAFVGEYLDGLK